MLTRTAVSSQLPKAHPLTMAVSDDRASGITELFTRGKNERPGMSCHCGPPCIVKTARNQQLVVAAERACLER